ncbi:MAG: hypothetical protein ACRERD_02925, partial [Candidatus Binatia bacterium]
MQLQGYNVDLERARALVNSQIDQVSPELRVDVNKALHDNPETCYQEFFAHDALTAYLEKKGFEVKRKTYG